MGKKITSRIFVESKGRFYETNENFFFDPQVQCMVRSFSEVSKTSASSFKKKKKRKKKKKKAHFSKCEYHTPTISSSSFRYVFCKLSGK